MERFKSKILATGKFLPERVLTNADLEKMVETTDEWITERTGIKERHISDPEKNEFPSDMATNAAKDALASINMDPNEIEMIIFATVTPDMSVPGASCLVQTKLGITNNCACMDVNAACSGFVYAMTLANSMVQAGNVKNILVIGCDMLSSITNWKDRGTCILLGDGGGVAILGRAEENETSEILATKLFADGSGTKFMNRPFGGSASGITSEVIEANEQHLHMQGRDMFKMATRTLAKVAKDVLEQAGLTKDDVDWLIPHQANIRIIDTTVKMLDLNPEKVIINIQKYGNTSAGTIPIAFAEAIEEGKIKRGDIVLLDAFGAGLTAGAVLLRY